jgi:hypothetical protein
MTDELADEPLSGTDVLAYAGLYRPAGHRDAGPEGPVREAGVRCGRPIIYPVPAEDLPAPLRHRAATSGRRYHGALFAFDLDDPGPDRRYSAARFGVTLGDSRDVAVQVYSDGGAFGLIYGVDAPVPVSPLALHLIGASGPRPGLLRRLLLRREQSRAWVSGVLTNDFGWVFEDPRGRLLVPRTYAMHALIEVPADRDRLDGTLGVRVEVVREVRGVRSYERATLRDAVTFAQPLSAVRPRAGAAVRLCMAADVSSYSQLRNPVAERIQRDLVGALARARRDAGLDDAEVARQPQGDGQFSVFPAGIDESEVIPRLVTGLHAALADTNRDAVDGSRMRLRVALHRGLMKEGDNGWVGTAAVAVHRLLDSPPVRAALRDNEGADFVLGVPDVLYRDVIVHSTRPPDPHEFREIVVDLPDKKFLENGWVYVASPGDMPY